MPFSISAAWTLLKPLRVPLAILIAALALLWALDAYGDRRYAQGKEDETRAWRAAEAALRDKEREAAAQADKGAAKREADHAATVAAERGKIDEALREGYSPFDVLFGRSGGVCVDKDPDCQPPGSR